MMGDLPKNPTESQPSLPSALVGAMMIDLWPPGRPKWMKKTSFLTPQEIPGFFFL